MEVVATMNGIHSSLFSVARKWPLFYWNVPSKPVWEYAVGRLEMFSSTQPTSVTCVRSLMP